jgi:hypothetical protein
MNLPEKMNACPKTGLGPFATRDMKVLPDAAKLAAARSGKAGM